MAIAVKRADALGAERRAAMYSRLWASILSLHAAAVMELLEVDRSNWVVASFARAGQGQVRLCSSTLIHTKKQQSVA